MKNHVTWFVMALSTTLFGEFLKQKGIPDVGKCVFRSKFQLIGFCLNNSRLQNHAKRYPNSSNVEIKHNQKHTGRYFAPKIQLRVTKRLYFFLLELLHLVSYFSRLFTTVDQRHSIILPQHARPILCGNANFQIFEISEIVLDVFSSGVFRRNVF